MFVEFEDYKMIEGGICAPKGFKAGGVAAGIKAGSTKRDLALIVCEKKCAAAAVYTQNKVKGAPITVTQQHLKDGMAQAVIVNSGNANTCNPNGIEMAEQMCELAAQALDIDKNDVIVGSTGVIGQTLSIDPIQAKMGELTASLSEQGSPLACEAIMTTDTRKKEIAVRFMIDGKLCYIGGISKGSGMINPNMATMLCFITTDVNIRQELLQKALKRVADITYNMVCVDGDTSTNDTACIMASGLAGNREITAEDKDYEEFINALYAVMMNLARETARDGEGATKLIECAVKGAPDEDIAKRIAKSVISSDLVKAAMFAADANCGRIFCAIGYTEGDFSIDDMEVTLLSEKGSIRVYENGAVSDVDDDRAHEILTADEITVLVDLHSGLHKAAAWGCDLTYDYVKINAEYRS
ncbi:MAG: bifunctional glutamate N-acetyltransferase/amino-acid acetyltransferase ArgJ [Eubacterium sp.]|nr:bifunctional glutamate N-acetyltransferase/amino-acid acetyltransferase ArgJ [Eubacterium sp.]